MGRKAMKGRPTSGGRSDRKSKDQIILKKHELSEPEKSFVRKQVDPETAKYFSEIANVVESGVDLDEQSVICGNALEESRGKEVELSTDYILSHTMQTLLDGCDADHLREFLGSCANNFAVIATDRCGSHVAETALNSLASHLQDEDCHPLIEATLTSICQAIVRKPGAVMSSCYGSHVLRSLLCLCKGVLLNSEFRATKASTVLARRLNLRVEEVDKYDLPHNHPGFPELLKFLISEMLNCSKVDISTLQIDQYSSLVLQTAMKLLAGQEEDLFHFIPVILGCSMENAVEGNFIKMDAVENIRNLLKEDAFNHLMEVILEVAPGSLYDEIFVKIFKGSFFELSCHHSANFAVQALISRARCQSQIDAIWEELGSKFKDLLEAGRPGVVASLIAASQRLHTHEHKCSKALAAAICSVNEPSKFIIPRVLFLESYFSALDKSNWSWASDSKMQVMGSLILQTIFKYPSEFIQPYITSITSMESSHVLETAKDAAGQRVLEAFLSSTASDKQKKKLVSRLKGYFGELAMHPSGSFTVERCFNASDVPLREAIVSDLVAVQKELSKTRQGPLLLRNLDVDEYFKRPEQWRSRQKSKLSVYKEFLSEFSSAKDGSSTQPKQDDGPLSYKKKPVPVDNSNKATQQQNLKKMRQEIDDCLVSVTPSNDKSVISGSKRGEMEADKRKPDNFESQRKEKKRKKKGATEGKGDAAVASKRDDQKHSTDKKGKRRRKDELQNSSKKLKT